MDRIVSLLFGIVPPPIFTWFSGNWITLGLGDHVGHGANLRLDDFRRVTQLPSGL